MGHPSSRLGSLNPSRHALPRRQTPLQLFLSALALSMLAWSLLAVSPASANQPPVLKILDPDVNDDGVVDLFNDIFGVSNAFGTSCGQPGFNPAYDLNGDCTVDLFNDIYLAAYAFGTACWPTPAPTAQCPIGNPLTIPQDQLLQFYVKATDQENQPLTYTATNLPAGSCFNQLNANSSPGSCLPRHFTWTPTAAQSSCYIIGFTANDGTRADTKWLTIGVNRTSCPDKTGLFLEGPDSEAKGSTSGNPKGGYTEREKKTGDDVYPHNGELHLTVVDLEIPGRGIPFQFVRRYKSQVTYNGPIGFNWEFNYNARLVQERDALGAQTGNLLHLNGFARQDRYVGNPDGSFTSPQGYFTKLSQNPDGTFTLRNRDGMKWDFFGFAGALRDGSLAALRDGNGNTLRFQYGAGGRLTTILDTLSRPITLSYDANGRISQLADFAGRTVSYAYDANGDLVAVNSPVVTGTPNGNDFPSGKTTAYTYSSGFAAAALNHNLLAIIRPNEVALTPDGPPVLVVTYGTNPADPLTFDRVTRQVFGGQNQASQTRGVPAAGGPLHYFYQTVSPCTNPNDLTAGCVKTTVVDRVGNVTAYTYNVNRALISQEEFTGRVDPQNPGSPPVPTGPVRPTDPPSFITTYEYTADNLLTRTVLPEGNRIEYVYDTTNPDRFQQGNLLELERVPDAARGGDVDDPTPDPIRTLYTYEPIYNQLRTSCDPRGSDPDFVPPLEPLLTGCGRYVASLTFDYQEGNTAPALAAELRVTEAEVNALLAAAGVGLNLGDLNGDGLTNQSHGNVVRTTAPTVNLLPGSQQATVEGDTTQEVLSDYSYNAFGQLTKTVDPEGNVANYTYYPENDPDGDGFNISPTPGLSPTTFGYLKQALRDDAPRHSRRRDLTPLTQILTRYFYDRVGNITGLLDGRGIRTTFIVNQLNQVVRTFRAADVSQSPEAGLIAFSYTIDNFYDHNDNLIKKEIQNKDGNTDSNSLLTSTYAYDILDHLIERTEEVSPTKTLAYGVRYDGNENLVKTIEPIGNFHTTEYDERDLVFRRTTGANDPTIVSTTTYNYDKNENLKTLVDAQDHNGDGQGDATTYVYDGFDRFKRTIDAVGNEAIQTYDPASNVLRAIGRGRIGGPSPTTNDTSVNVELARASAQYDELSRTIRSDADWFLSTGIIPVRPTTLGDGKSSMVYEYDRNSRLTRSVNDNNHKTDYSYDGANRRIVTAFEIQNKLVVEYDDNSNVTKLTEVEKRGDDLTVPAEVFVTINRYDALNRLRLNRDNIGQTTRFAYDSRNNPTITCDAVGPVDLNDPQLGLINRCGNTTRSFYDGINRVTQTISDLRTGGQGNGTPSLDGPTDPTVDPPNLDLSNSANPDGKVTVSYVWDDNSRLQSQADDKGNATSYSYDSLNRRIVETFADGTTNQFTYDRDSNLIQQIDENGTRLNSTYDAINRLITRSIQRAGNEVAATTPGVVVGGTTSQTLEYDGLSRLTKGTDNNDPATATDDATVTRLYDSLSRLIEESQNTKLISTSYDGVSNELKLTYPNNRTISMAYDALERLDIINDDRIPEPNNIVNYSYLGPGRVLERTYLNGTKLTYLSNVGLDVGYDGLKRLIAHRHETSGDARIAEFTYGYDRANNRKFERKLHELIGPNPKGEAYTYDSLYRLIDFKVGPMGPSGNLLASPTTQSAYQLDGVGNRVTETKDILTIPYTTNVMNEYTTIGLTPQAYEDNGNLTDDGTNTYAYDAFNRLLKVTRKADSAVIAAYTYDSLHRRVKKVVTTGDPALDGTTRYFHDGNRAIEERDGADAVTNQYVFGNGVDEFLTLENSLGTFYFHDNALGSMVAATNASQTVAERYSYDAFGKPTITDGTGTILLINSAIKNPYLFTGRYLDPETGLYYYRLRYYNPATGRFLQRDPGGMWSDAYNTGNAYTYVGNNPANLVDPMGLGSQPTTQEPQDEVGKLRYRELELAFKKISLEAWIEQKTFELAKIIGTDITWHLLAKTDPQKFEREVTKMFPEYPELAKKRKELEQIMKEGEEVLQKLSKLRSIKKPKTALIRLREEKLEGRVPAHMQIEILIPNKSTKAYSIGLSAVPSERVITGLVTLIIPWPFGQVFEDFSGRGEIVHSLEVEPWQAADFNEMIKRLMREPQTYGLLGHNCRQFCGDLFGFARQLYGPKKESMQTYDFNEPFGSKGFYGH